MRHLRQALPAGLADSGSEAALWQHPARLAGDFALLPGDPAEQERMRQAARASCDLGRQRLAWDLVRTQQADGTSRAQCMEERILYAALQGGTDAEAEAFLDRVAKALDQARRVDDAEHARYLAA
jgi:hypothetical protein